MLVYDGYGARVLLGSEVAKGSRATFYEIPGQPGKLAKLYHSYHEIYEAKLRLMIAHPPAIAESPSAVAAMSWPLALLYNARASFLGYVLREVPQAASFQRLLDPTDQAQATPGRLQRQLHQVAYHLAHAVQSLHAAGYVAGTLSPRHILVTLPTWVTLIDTDSMQVQSQHIAETILYRTSLSERAYLAPEFQYRDMQRETLTAEQDRFALALLLFQLLMRGHHPFEVQWCGSGSPPTLEECIAEGLYPYTSSPRGPVIPPRYAPRLDWLHPRLVEFFERCFMEGHESPWRRPWPVEWQEALRVAEGSLRFCLQDHYYSSYLPSCPYCTFQFGPPAPRPLVEDLEALMTSLPPSPVNGDDIVIVRAAEADARYQREWGHLRAAGFYNHVVPPAAAPSQLPPSPPAKLLFSTGEEILYLVGLLFLFSLVSPFCFFCLLLFFG